MGKYDYLCDGYNSEPRKLKDEEMGRKLQDIKFDWAMKLQFAKSHRQEELMKQLKSLKFNVNVGVNE